MRIRLISGSVYIAILLAFYFMKVLLPHPYGDFCMDVMLYVFAWIGTFEMLRAVQQRTTKKERTIVYIFTAICIPACALSEYFFGAGLQASCFCVLGLSVALLSLLVAEHEETSLENIGLALLAAVYPTLLLSVFVLGNHLNPPAALVKIGFDSRLFILFVFVISPCTDGIAYIFGRFLRKYFPKKLAPVLSPNKTVIGGIGGLVGGMLGALILYFVYGAAGGAGAMTDMHIWLPIYLFIGLISSAVCEFGDLVESCIKRKVGLKDMGKIMPGHGGILDRIDGILFVSLITYILFLLIYIIV